MTSLAVSPPVWDLFLECDKPAVMQNMAFFLTRDTAGMVAAYVVGKENPFGAAEWKKHFDIIIIDPPKLPASFYEFWFGPDPIELTKKCCETHLPPVFRPKGMSLKRLEQLVRKPKDGHRLKFPFKLTSPALYQIENHKAGPACYLVLRKGVVERGATYETQKKFIRFMNAAVKIGYEEEPSAIDFATVIFARYISTGEPNLSGFTSHTYSRTKEIGKDTSHPIIGNFTSSGLVIEPIDLNSREIEVGIACLRRF